MLPEAATSQVGNPAQVLNLAELQTALEHGSDQIARLINGDLTGFGKAMSAFAAGALSESQMIAMMIASFDAILQAQLCGNVAGWAQSKLILEDRDFQYMRLYNERVAQGKKPPTCDELLPEAQKAADKARDDMKLVGEIMDYVRDLFKELDPHAFGQGQDVAPVLDLILQIIQDVVLALVTAGLGSIAREVAATVARLLMQSRFGEAIAELTKIAKQYGINFDRLVDRIRELQQNRSRIRASEGMAAGRYALLDPLDPEDAAKLNSIANDVMDRMNVPSNLRGIRESGRHATNRSGDSFEFTGRGQGGRNTRQGRNPRPEKSGSLRVDKAGLAVDEGVLNDELIPGSEAWRNADLRTRMEAIIAHEQAELRSAGSTNAWRHFEALIKSYNDPRISAGAKEIIADQIRLALACRDPQISGPESARILQLLREFAVRNNISH